jgi:hypothetical protein
VAEAASGGVELGELIECRLLIGPDMLEYGGLPGSAVAAQHRDQPCPQGVVIGIVVHLPEQLERAGPQRGRELRPRRGWCPWRSADKTGSDQRMRCSSSRQPLMAIVGGRETGGLGCLMVLSLASVSRQENKRRSSERQRKHREHSTLLCHGSLMPPASPHAFDLDLATGQCRHRPRQCGAATAMVTQSHMFLVGSEHSPKQIQSFIPSPFSATLLGLVQLVYDSLVSISLHVSRLNQG